MLLSNTLNQSPLINMTDFSKIPEAQVVVKHILARLKKGLYSLVLVTGLPGSGKSSTCLRLKELLSTNLNKTIDPSKKITIDTLLDLLEALKNSSPGDILVIEELSVLFPSRRSMSADNVAIARVLDTCRKKQVILITNAPLLKSIDSHIRALGNILIETQRVNKIDQVVISKAFRLQTDVRTSKTYTHRFIRNGNEVHLVYTRKPSAEIWRLYESEKDTFIDKLYDKLQEQQEKKEGKEKKTPKPLRPLTKKELEVYDLYFKQGMTMTDIAAKAGCSIPLISKMVKNIKKKAEFPLENQGLMVKIPNSEPHKITYIPSEKNGQPIIKVDTIATI